MKATLTLFIFCLSIFAMAQPIDDRTETNCDGNSRSVYDVAATGMSIIVASKGFDCSYCMNQAPEVAEFANENIGAVQIWGAMKYTYSSATPDCDDVNTWDNTYGWDNVFSFVDESGYWASNGTPFYQVIDPNTLEFAYQGPYFSIASTTALGLTTLDNTTIIEEKGLSINAYENKLNLKFWAHLRGLAELEVYNIVGQRINTNTFEINQGTNTIDLPFNSKDGIYIAKISLSNGQMIAYKFMSYTK